MQLVADPSGVIHLGQADGFVAHVRCTGRADGDLAPGAPEPRTEPSAGVRERWRAVIDRPWTWLRQVHGGDVVIVRSPGQHAGAFADAAITADPSGLLAVFSADCAPVALVSAEGPVGIAHAGWRGIMAGVLERATVALRDLGAADVVAVLGPCIRAGCYEFGAADLAEISRRLGPAVVASSTCGTPALDLPAAVKVALDQVGVPLVHDVAACTACSPDLWSHRARGDAERQATVVWRTAP